MRSSTGRPAPPGRCSRRPRRTRGAARGAAAVGLGLLVVAASGGCTAEAKAPETPSPFAGCAVVAAGPSAAPPSASAGAAVSDLPDLELPCFTGGVPVALRDLRRPAVLNLWASWCDPCRRELPVMQSLADRAGDRLAVVGVDTGDGREAAASFATDRGVTMPTLFDADRKLITALAGTALPITVFLDGHGRSYVNRLPLDAAGLAELVRAHTGVTVTP